MDKIQAKSEQWMEEEHMDMEKSGQFEQEADEIYESLHKLFDQAAERIVSTTSGQIDKITAMKMIRCRRKDVERIFAQHTRRQQDGVSKEDERSLGY